jgi:hypothetical protein
MAADQFNSLGGFSVGIPAITVVDSNGNVVSNFNNLSGNVSAGNIYATEYYFSNGVPFTSNAGGNVTELQFNDNGSFGGVLGTSWDGNKLTLGNISNVRITGGINGYFLQTDGQGNLTWAPAGNGTGGNGTPGGANTQVQFNDAGDFGGASGFTFDKNTNVLSVSGNIIAGTLNVNTNANINGVVQAASFIGDGSQLSNIEIDTANTVTSSAQPNITSLGTLTSLSVSGITDLGSVSNVKISGGIPGYVLTTDGTGNVSWELAGGGNGTPGGGNTQIQFNDGGSFGGTTAFTFNKVSNAVNMTGNLSIRNLTANNATFYDNVIVAGNITSTAYFGDGSFLSNVQSNVANTVAVANQPNITSVGTLTSLSVSGNILTSQAVSAARFQTSGNANVGTLTASTGITSNGTLSASGNVNFSTSGNINLGSVDNIRISGGLNGYVLSTDGLGILSWAPPGGGTSSTPGGANTQIQYNSSSNFAGSPFFTFNDVTNTVQVGGKLIANTMQLGSGAFKFGTSAVYFATTSSTSKTVLYSIPVSEVSGVDFEIIGTDSAGQKRQAIKMSSLYFAGVVTYNEYAGLYINGGVGNFEVEYNSGNVITPPSLDLVVTPDTTNNTVYKMLITVLAP